MGKYGAGRTPYEETMSAKGLNAVLAIVLAIVIVVAVVFAFKNFGLRRDLGTTGGQLRRSIRSEQIKRDSIHELEARIEVLKMSMAHKVIELRDSLKQKSEESTKWNKAYVKAKATHIDRAIPNDSIDSLISGLVGDR